MKKIFPILSLIFGLNLTSNAQAPANDLCNDAISLTVGAACTPGTNVAATTDVAFENYYGSLVWYSFVATSDYTKVSLTNSSDSLDAVIYVVENGCANPANNIVGFADDGLDAALDETVVFATSIGSTYFVAIGGYTEDGNAEGTFCLAVTTTIAPPSNDDPAGAIALTPGAVCLNGTTVGAFSTSGLIGNSYKGEVWYTFVAGSDSSSVSLTSVGPNLDAAIFVFDTIGGTANLVVGADAGLTGGLDETAYFLTVAGTTYFVAVSGYQADYEDVFCIAVNDLGNISSIDTKLGVAELRVYPNPAQNSIQLSHSEEAQFDLVTITDLTGKVVLSSSQSNTNIEKLSAGAYLIQVSYRGSLVGTSRFVKN